MADGSHPAVRERFVSHPLRGCASGAALLGVVALMSALIPPERLSVDRRWWLAMGDIETSLLTHLAFVFNWLGRGVGFALTLVAVGIVLARGRRWLALAAFAIVEGLTWLSSALLKEAIARHRPPDGLVRPASSSFPSGHAAYAAATCVALVLLFTTPGARRRWWALAALGILGMAWSRTYLHAHWLSDVVGGSLLGIGTALLIFSGAQWWAERRLSRR